MPTKTEKLVKNIMNDKNYKARENLESIIQEKVENKLRNVLRKNSGKKS